MTTEQNSSRRTAIAIGRVLALFAILGLWEAVSRSGVFPPAFVGRPSVFLPFLAGKFLDGSIFPPIADTLTATLVAFVAGSVLAFAAALLLTVFPLLREWLQPYIDALNALPRVALVPLFIVWFGLGMVSKIVSGVSLVFFILLYNTLAGAQSVDPDHRLLARSLGISAREVFLQIVIPTAMPAIFTGLRLGLVYTLLGVVTAELIAGGKGLGSLISYYSNTFDADGVFAILIVLILISYVLSAAMTRLEYRLTRWRG